MAFNLTVEDNSPLVSYAPSGAWTDNSDSDSFIQSYSGKSLHTTFAQGATATINFNGTGIWLFGGTRPIYGTYTIAVDGQTITNGAATSADPAFNQLLGGTSGLANGPHTLVYTHTGLGTAVDLDSFVFQGQVGSGAGDSVSSTTIDDTDSRITYAPSIADWQVDTQLDLNINDTLHFTQVQGASATIPFTGDAVAVYGSVSPDHSNILISLDGQTSAVQGGAGVLARISHTKTLLYYADNLGYQEHQLVLSSDQSSNTGQFIDFDAITVYSSSNVTGGINNGSVPTPNDSPRNARRTRLLPAIIGGAVGAVALLLLIAAFFFFLHCRRQRKRNSLSNALLTPSLPMQQAGLMEAGLHRNSNHFLEVKISPGGLPSGPPQVLTLPFERSASTRPYSGFTASVISNSLLVEFPEPPPPTLSRLTPNGPVQNTRSNASESRAPVRPMRPPSLVLSP